MLRKKSSSRSARPGGAIPVAAPASASAASVSPKRRTQMPPGQGDDGSADEAELDLQEALEDAHIHQNDGPKRTPSGMIVQPPQQQVRSIAQGTEPLAPLSPIMPAPSSPTLLQQQQQQHQNGAGSSGSASSSSTHTSPKTHHRQHSHGNGNILPNAQETTGHGPMPQESPASSLASSSRSTNSRAARIEKIIHPAESVDLEALKSACWSGIPTPQLRAQCWRILCGFPKQDSLVRKRHEFAKQLVPYYFHNDKSKRSADEEAMWHQIEIDVPRTRPGEPLFQHPRVSLAMQRVLYIWSLKHPASGYVQGINDLVTPLLSVFVEEAFPAAFAQPGVTVSSSTGEPLVLALSSVADHSDQNHGIGNSMKISRSSNDVQQQQQVNGSSKTSAEDLNRVGTLSEAGDGMDSVSGACTPAAGVLSEEEERWMAIEADTYWCFTKFSDPLAEHYTFAQPGIQKMVYKLEELIKRLDPVLHRHLTVDCQVQFLQFGFRWCNCLLIREWSQSLSIRLYDTYISEGPRFVVLHVYVCAALLMKFASRIMELDFTECMMFLQNLPTKGWSNAEIDLLISQAYVWMNAFEDSPSHYLH